MRVASSLQYGIQGSGLGDLASGINERCRISYGKKSEVRFQFEDIQDFSEDLAKRYIRSVCDFFRLKIFPNSINQAMNQSIIRYAKIFKISPI